MSAPEMRECPRKGPEMACHVGKKDASLHQMILDCRCAASTAVSHTFSNFY